MTIKTENDAEEFLRPYHGLHDGFIKQIAIQSDDWFDWRSPKDMGHIITGTLSAEILFARHPTLDGTVWPAMLRCVFRGVADVQIDFRSVQGEGWPLYDVRIADAGNGRLSLQCAWKENDYRQLFTFEEMENT